VLFDLRSLGPPARLARAGVCRLRRQRIPAGLLALGRMRAPAYPIPAIVDSLTTIVVADHVSQFSPSSVHRYRSAAMLAWRRGAPHLASIRPNNWSVCGGYAIGAKRTDRAAELCVPHSAAHSGGAIDDLIGGELSLALSRASELSLAYETGPCRRSGRRVAALRLAEIPFRRERHDLARLCLRRLLFRLSRIWPDKVIKQPGACHRRKVAELRRP
jgi:hypothetical protein